jgi:hypothetical protein
MVGDAANQTVFLVIQHSNHIPTQQYYLPLLRESVLLGESRGKDLA